MDPAGGRVLAEELVADQALELLGLLAVRHRRLDHLEDPGAVAERQPPAFSAAAQKLSSSRWHHSNSGSWSDERHQHRRLHQPVFDHPGEDLVALDLAAIPPHLGLAAQKLAQAHLERALETFHPAGLARHQRHVVAVGVAEEKVLLG